ncbi:MAG: AMP-binding protein [Bacteroidaceae bacterium]|nr:AMP-binding protein [Bacteroidaceae bacterium]
MAKLSMQKRVTPSLLEKTAIIAGERNVSFAQALRYIDMFAQQIPSSEQKRIIVFSENSEGWIYAFFSIWQQGGVAVPVDASSTVSDFSYILRDCTPHGIWTSRHNVPVVEQALKETGLSIPFYVIENVMEQHPDAARQLPDRLPWAELDVPYNQHVALIIYTSGTTGSPKGVMLSFQNLMANIKGVSQDVRIFSRTNRTMILLPLHHVLPLMGSVVAPFWTGGGVAICPSLTAPDLMDTLCRGKVAIVIGVPRLWQMLYGGIKKKIDSNAITAFLFRMCAFFRSRTFSRFVFSSIRRKMGGHVKYFVSGGAALSKEIGEGLKIIGLDVLEGYGMTETAPIICFTRPTDIRPGCVGLPLPGIECKLINGELCAKGPNVMLGYYNRPEETAAVIDKDGYLHTGDLATIGKKGHVTITGRTKEIIVLSNGKNIEPSEIEYKLEQYDYYVKEVAVMQDNDLLRAIVVPQSPWASLLNDTQVEVALKREVIEPYNRSVVNYKKIMALTVYRGELPRTKLDKLQRFRLQALLEACRTSQPVRTEDPEPDMEEYRIIKQYIEQEKKVPVKPSSHVETDLAMDSLDKVGLQGFIEHTFGMRLVVDEMASFANIKEMAEHVASCKTKVEVEEVDWYSLLNENVSDLRIPQASCLFPFVNKCFKLFFRVYNSLRIHGRIQIPAKGPYILAPNHQSFVDAPVVLSGLTWRQIKSCYFFATEQHVKSKFRRALADRNNTIIMEQAHLKESIQKLAQVLKKGKNIVIFPEGSRTHDGELGDFKLSFAILSKELNIPIIPVCIRGAYEALPRHRKYLYPRHIEVHYLPPVIPTSDITYQQLADKVKQAIQKVL